jgi:hypothetical protein
MHQLERRGVDGIAAEVAQEITMLLQHDHIDAGARQKEAKHHAGRPPAGDATFGRYCARTHGVFLHFVRLRS